MALVLMGASEKKPIFHDFLGMSCGEPSTTASAPVASAGGDWEKGREKRDSEKEAQALAYVAASSERQVVNNSEVFAFHGRKNAISGADESTTFSGRKRSNSDSAYMGTLGDCMLSVGSESLENSRILKMHGKDVVSERMGRSHDEETVFSMQPPPRPTSLILHPPLSGRPDPLIYKWERSIATNPVQMVHYPSRFAQRGNYVEKPSSSYAYGEAIGTGAMLISQAAADEGSRTGIKGSGVVNVSNPSTGGGERILNTASPHSNRPKAPLQVEKEASYAPSRQGMVSAGRQMTIFYAGQAHVFDDVHPNKADVIMALAGSTGASWSTIYSPKPGVSAQTAEAKAPIKENDIRSNLAPSIKGNLAALSQGSQLQLIGDHPNPSPGGLQGGATDTRGATPAAEPDANAKSGAR